MEAEKVRVINGKGEVKFVMPHIAKDKKLMKNYGYRVEDLNTKENKADSVKGVIDDIVIGLDNKEPLDLLGQVQDEKPKKRKKTKR